MSNESRVSARAALARIQAVTDSPPATVTEAPASAPDAPPQPALRIEPEPPPKTAPPVFEQSVRYTVEMPKSLHRRLKGFVLDNETTSYAVTNALVRLMLDDQDLVNRVRDMIQEGPSR
ncbi:MAG: hypothetical protein JF885_12750 [Candidatus Dormibacteraeota bacterium]|nr:hypothetical protein [Candidatus Dormibacteraeota bacterium]MBJ7613692.1 hypothetical protein [Candidatus Dormibacteraeota bacterium]